MTQLAKPEFKEILEKEEDELTDDEKLQLTTFQELYKKRFMNHSIEKYSKDKIMKEAELRKEINSWIDDIF